MKKEQEKEQARKMRTIRMTDAEWRAIRIMAAARDVTASELVRQVMVDFVKKNKVL